jgi:hypothetical protein
MERHEQLMTTGKEIVQGAPQLFIDVDVEADGKPGYGSLLSIGAIAPAGEEFYVELKPTSKNWIKSQRDFCERHGLERKRLQEEGEAPSQALRQLADWVGDLRRASGKLAIMTTFNHSFDYGFIDLYCYETGTINPFETSPFDIKSRILGLQEGWDWAQTGKGKLPTALLPEGDFTHNALEDARYQQKIHFALAGLLNLGGRQ